MSFPCQARAQGIQDQPSSPAHRRRSVHCLAGLQRQHNSSLLQFFKCRFCEAVSTGHEPPLYTTTPYSAFPLRWSLFRKQSEGLGGRGFGRGRFHLPPEIRSVSHGVTETKSSESPVSLALKQLFSQDTGQTLKHRKWAGETAQLVRCLPCKHRNQNSISVWWQDL